MFNSFQSWNIRKKLMGWCLLVALVPMLVMVVANLSFQANNLRKSIGDRLMDNRRGLQIALSEEHELFLEQTQRTAVQPMLLSAVSIKNLDTLVQLLMSYLRMNQTDLYGVYDSEGKPFLVLQKDRIQDSSMVIPLHHDGVSSLKASGDDLSIDDDFTFDDVDVGLGDQDLFSFDEVSMPSPAGAEKIVLKTVKALSPNLIDQLSSEGSVVSRTVQSDGIMQSSFVTLEFGGRQIGSLWQGILIDRIFADRLKKRTGLEVALIHPEGNSIVSTLPGLKALTIDDRLSDVKEVKVNQRDYLYTLLPFGETKGFREGGIALFQSLETLHADRKKFAILSLFIFGSITAVVVLMSSLISNSFSRPLQLLMMTAHKIAGGDFTKRVPVASSDEIAQLASSFNNMTDSLQHSRDALVSAKEYTDNILKSMLNALIVVSPEGRIQTLNKASCALLGYEEQELVAQPVGLIFDKAPFSTLQIGKTRLIEYLQKNERIFVTKTGRKIPVLFTGSVMYDHNGEIEGIVCLAQDISNQKKAEAELKAYSEALQRSHRELQDFTHISSHDLQEPLRKVIIFGDRLRLKYEHILEAQGKQYLDRMRTAASRMQTQLDDLLIFSRLNRNRDPFVPVDLSAIAREVISDLEAKIEETGGSIIVGDLPAINAEPVLMRQLLQNLIGNGLKFCKQDEAPVVKVDSQISHSKGSDGSETRVLKLFVEDNGIGFEEKYADRIFTVFQQVHDRSKYGGNGVGLAVCRKIAEHHGGTITARSTPGKGSVFLVIIPFNQTQGGEN